MFATWSPFARRLLAIGLFVLSVLIIFDYVVAPVLGSFAAQSTRIEDLEAQYTRFSDAASRQATARMRLDELRADQTWREPLVPAESARTAGASLQTLLREKAEAAGARTLSFQPVDRAAEYGFTVLGVRLELEASNEQLAKFLQSLDEAGVAMTFDGVTIRHRGVQAGSNSQTVRVRADVFAFWAPEVFER